MEKLVDDRVVDTTADTLEEMVEEQ